MAIDANTATSRRALLLASVGGAAALVAQAIGRPLSIRAADGEAVEVGGEYQGDSVTQITASGGVNAIAGVSDSGVGLAGSATTGSGVTGAADTGIGILGTA